MKYKISVYKCNKWKFDSTEIEANEICEAEIKGAILFNTIKAYIMASLV